MKNIYLFVILLSFGNLWTHCEEVKLAVGGADTENSTFVATEEWQEIKPGMLFFRGSFCKIYGY